ncbi:hypothetical protein CH282_04325 [Rhodococcus sp. 06-418-1B]|nr:hypothetical protein CH282_04325 [Rhodococcus sp. 06-418-1B]
MLHRINLPTAATVHVRLTSTSVHSAAISKLAVAIEPQSKKELGNIHKDGARIYSHPPTTPRWRRPAVHRSTHRFVDDANERIRIGWSVEPRRRGSFRLSADVHAYC